MSNQIFKEHVTSVAFNLSLSIRMCSLLLMLDGGEQVLGRYSHFVPVICSLMDRGLVIRHERKDDNVFDFIAYTLTPAGKLVAELVRMAGIVPVIKLRPAVNMEG